MGEAGRAAVSGTGRLTTHVLDTATGRPAGGMALELWHLPGSEPPQRIGGWTTNADGRVDAPLLQGTALRAGEYELLFDVAGWRAGAGFYDTVPIRFRIHDADAHYHVPLILSPFSYATYRGS